MAEEDKKKSGGFLKSLTKVFAKVALTTALFFISGYAGAMVFDYGSVGNVHNHLNDTSYALREFSEWLLSPFHSFMGTDIAQNGVLQSEFVQSTLNFKKFYSKNTIANNETIIDESGIDSDFMGELTADLMP